jgi:type I restriction enzyme, S subunit
MIKLSRLGDISSVITKGTTPTSVGFDFSDCGVPFLRVQNLADGAVDLTKTPLYISEATHKELARSAIHPGDVLISIAGTIGRVAIVADDAVEMNSNQAVGIVRLNHGIQRRYILHWLQSHDAKKQITGAQVTATISNLSLTELRSLQIPLPPLAEQKRIAAILDKADAIRRKLQQSLRLSDDFLRSVFLDMFGDPVTNPKGFPKTALGEIIKLKSGNGLVGKDMAYGGIYPVYGGNGINGYHDSFMFEQRMIVLGRVGAYCGVVHYTLPKSWITDNALYVESMKRKMDPIYLVDALRFANLNQYAGQAGQPLISGGRVYPVEILDPSPDLQASYAAIVTKTQTKIQKSTALLQEAETLFSSLQQRAFRGEL